MYIRDVDYLDRKLQAFSDDPSIDTVHDFRTAVRRLDASLSVLPKQIRKRNKAKSLLKALGRLMKESANLRDWDTVGSRLSSYPASPARDGLIQEARKKRWECVPAVRKAADAERDLSAPRVRSGDLSGRLLQKRFDSVTRRLASKVDSCVPLVLGDETRIRELHTLRKDCKRLRYVLELGPRGKMKRSLSTLESWQDLLGAIRDSDVTIAYLRSLPKTADVERILNAEARLRRKHYDSFVRLRKVRKWTEALS